MQSLLPYFQRLNEYAGETRSRKQGDDEAAATIQVNGDDSFTCRSGCERCRSGGALCSCLEYRLDKAFFLKILIQNYIIFKAFHNASSSLIAVKEGILIQ